MLFVCAVMLIPGLLHIAFLAVRIRLLAGYTFTPLEGVAPPKITFASLVRQLFTHKSALISQLCGPLGLSASIGNPRDHPSNCCLLHFAVRKVIECKAGRIIAQLHC